MEAKEVESNDLERLSQAVSPNDEPCDYPATVYCSTYGRWFCDAHAEDEEWHPCMLRGGDEVKDAANNPFLSDLSGPDSSTLEKALSGTRVSSFW